MIFLFVISIFLFIFSIDYISKNIDTKLSDFIKELILKINHNKFLLLLIGILSTIFVQSSSLIISLIIILTGKKKISFTDSIFLIMGSNIGTCSTAFISSIDSICLIISLFFIYIILKIFFKKNFEVLFGIIMLLTSIKVLDYAALPLSNSSFFLNLFSNQNPTHVNIIISSVITGITQSSSAIIAMLQSLAKINLINIKTVTDMMMGANIGTCVTAFIVGFRGNEITKKCAKFNFIFNIIGVIAFLFFRKIINIYKIFNVYDIKLQVAYIHLLFNILNVFVYLPFLYKKK